MTSWCWACFWRRTLFGLLPSLQTREDEEFCPKCYGKLLQAWQEPDRTLATSGRKA